MTQAIATSSSNFNYHRLYENLGYHFLKPALLQQALRHRSLGRQDNNERLEFLGDGLLNMLIAEQLYLQHPEWNEGLLSAARASLVNQAELAEIAKQLALDQFISLTSSEQQHQGQQRPSTLADALEAVLAAIYLDSDLATAKKCLCSWYGERLILPSATNKHSFKDAKSRLQEYLQQSASPLATYHVLAVTGPDHKQQFTLSCTIMLKGTAEAPVKLLTEGIGRSKRLAEQAAAAKMLDLIHAQQRQNLKK